MLKSKPLVSIIIPVYNGENYLREAIDSALAQTYDNCEIIIVNDGSTDKTEGIALSYGSKIKYFKKENGGQSSALNLGISKMQGEYFSWLSHDDLYYPQKVNNQISKLTENENKYACVFSNYSLIDSEGKKIKSEQVIKNGEIHPSFYLLSYNTYNGNTLLIPRKAFNLVGTFNELHPLTSDVELFFNLGLEIPFYFVNEELVASRIHKGQMTYRKYKEHQKEIDMFLIQSISKISNDDLLNISKGKNLKSVIGYLAKIWSKAGHRKAYLFILNRFNIWEIDSFFYYILNMLKCDIYYSWKLVRRIVRRTYSKTNEIHI